VSVELRQDADTRRSSLRSAGRDGRRPPRGLTGKLAERRFAEQVADHSCRLIWSSASSRRTRRRSHTQGPARPRPASEQAEKIIEHLSPRSDEDWYDPERLERLLLIADLSVEDRPVILFGERPIEDLSLPALHGTAADNPHGGRSPLGDRSKPGG